MRPRMRWAITIVASSTLVACGRGFTLDLSDGSASGSGAQMTSDPDTDTASGGDCIPTSSAERCDGIDNDCDGQVDEDVAPVTCGFGGCEATVYCEDGVMPECQPLDPSPEQCNLTDDDCDGEVDEGFSFGPLGEAIVLRSDEFNTGPCTTCSWAWGTMLAPVDTGFLALWTVGLLGGSEQPNLFGRFVDPLGAPLEPVQLLREDFILDMYPVQALAPMPPLGLPAAIQHRAPGQPDSAGLLYVGTDAWTTTAIPIVGSGAYNVERTVWTGERFVTAWEEDDQLRVAVLSPTGALEQMVEVDPLERPARATLGVYPGRVGIMVSRVRIEQELWDQWFIQLDSVGNVVTPAHPIDVEYQAWQRVVGTEQGWLHVRPNAFDEPSTVQPLDVDGVPLADARPFSDGRLLDDSGLGDTFIPRPGLGEMLTVWSEYEPSIMHVEFLDDDGETLRGWSGPIAGDPPLGFATVVEPHAQFVDDHVVVIWHGTAADNEPNPVYVRAFGCVP